MGGREQRAQPGGLNRRGLLQRAGGGAALLAGASGLEGIAAAGQASAAGGVTPKRLRELRRMVNGAVLTPGAADYDAARLIQNERFDDVRPPAVVQVRGVGDVKAVMRWANRHDVKVTARSGGHSYGGYSTTRGGVVIDLRRLRGVDAGRGARQATVGAGLPLSGFYAQLARRGITVPGGTCPTVGVAGLTLGGGVGLATRKYGLTLDNLTGIGIVTPDGRYRDVTARKHANLFWACRGGGGGNFGVVTSLTFATHPAPDVTYFHATWPWESADAGLDAWQHLAPFAPDDLTVTMGFTTHKKHPKLGCNGQFFGTEAELRDLIKPLAAVDGFTLDEIGTDPYGDVMLRWAGCRDETPRDCRAGEERNAFYASADYVRTPLDSTGRARMLEAIEAAQPFHDTGGGAQIILDPYGGAVAKVDPTATAFIHREELYDIQYVTQYSAGGRAAANDWVRAARRLMRPHVSGASYQNYIDPKLRGWKRAYYGENLERLIDVKSRWDPDGRLRFRQGIPIRS